MDLTNFDVGNIGKMKNSSINEGNEFGPNSNATRSVDNGTPDANVSVPGGVKETPSSKPYDQHSVTVPDSHAVAGANVSVPGKINLTDSEYNAALDMLQRSFKEAGKVLNANYEAIDRLKEARIIPDSDAYEQNIVESAIDDALLSALENGPLFEAVDRSDKKEVKRIVSEIRKDIKKACENEGVSFYKPALVARLLTTLIPAAAALTPAGAASGVAIAAGNVMSGATISSWQQVFTTRLWQVLGICHIESGNVTTLQNALTEKFKEQLGDYKILLVRTTPSLHDAFKVKFNWKNNKGTYFMLVDKKLDSEIKKIISSIKPEEGNKEENNEVKTESFKEGNNMTDLYKEYLMDFAENAISGQPLSFEQFVECVDNYEENGELNFDESVKQLGTGYYSDPSDFQIANKNKKEIKEKGKEVKKNMKGDKALRELIDKLWNNYLVNYKSARKADKKAAGKKIPRDVYKGLMYKCLKPGSTVKKITVKDWENEEIERVEGEVVFITKDGGLKSAREMIQDEIENNRTTLSGKDLQGIADRMMNQCFELVPFTTSLRAVAESADMECVFEHLGSFLSENDD